MYDTFCRETLKYDTFCRKTLKYDTFCRETLKYGTFCRETLKYDTFCRETLKYGTFCRETLKYALRAKKNGKFAWRADSTFYATLLLGKIPNKRNCNWMFLLSLSMAKVSGLLGLCAIKREVPPLRSLTAPVRQPRKSNHATFAYQQSDQTKVTEPK